MWCHSCLHSAERDDANFLCRYGHLRSTFDDHKLGISLSASCKCHASHTQKTCTSHSVSLPCVPSKSADLHLSAASPDTRRSKPNGELRVEAADFVPGQWDKPKQADTIVKSESQQSLNSQTDGGSHLPGSDAHAQGWAQDYAHQYYSAQVRHGSCCCLGSIAGPATVLL